MTTTTDRVRRSSAIALAAVVLVTFALAAPAVAALVLVGASDPCGPGMDQSGDEIRAYRTFVLGLMAFFAVGLLLAMIAALILTSRCFLAAAVLGCAAGLAVGALLAGELNAARAQEATAEVCRERHNLPRPDITGTADVLVTIQDGVLRGTASGQAVCTLTPDATGTTWLSTDQGAQVEWPIGGWYLFDLQLVPRGSGTLPTPLGEELPVGATSPILEQSQADFWLLLSFGQPGSSAVYAALGGDGWSLDGEPGRPAQRITFDLPQLPELGGNTPVEAPASIQGTLSWQCRPDEPGE